jgi:ABC-type bacteriocin/lantibiotic exporter with double-glycine peptidase domain
MVIAEAAGGVALPFLIGLAIDDYTEGAYRGLVGLAAVGLGTTLLATFRRLLDVRLYARVYETVSATAYEQDAGLSAKTARLNMLREVADFFEYSMPGLIASISAFIGTLCFLAALSVPVFIGALAMAGLIVVVYAFTTGRTMVFNREYNNELERQVDILQRNETAQTKQHIGLLNVWLIKLSDLDATNYAISLTLTIGLQVFAVVTSTSYGTDPGTLLSVILYVFEFSATAAMLPDSWQEYVRLRDILRRLQATI